MVAHVATVAFLGLEARAVEVQVQVASGLPAFIVVGLPDKAVAESRERVRAALAAIGLSLPPKRITVNLSPADLPKEGSHYDLPIALGLLGAMGAVDAETLAGYAVVGELGLDGRLTPSPGVLLAAIHASSRSLGLICPAAQGPEAAWAGDIEVIAAPDLIALLNHFRGTSTLSPPQPGEADPRGAGPNLNQVKGQETAKRALEIAAAGGHNMLMTGPPGAGKSLLAACLPGILPDLTPSEALEVSMIASVAGALTDGRLIRSRPFREPHHSASMAALVGGGLKVRPGEVSLAHLGVLFLDELPEFQRGVLDSLRQPLETGTVSVARANAHVTFPARVQLVAAMNPCRCGHLGDPALACSRAPRCAADYQAKVSGPLLDHKGRLSSRRVKGSA
jgi:magnesium chelatase family protein